MGKLGDILREMFKPREVREAEQYEARKTLVKAVDKQLKPRIRELGFESARTETWRGSRFKSWLSGWGWIRMRDDRVDLLNIYWEKHGTPRFYIEFSSQHVEDWEAIRWGDRHNFGSVKPQEASAPKRAWFGERQTPDETIALATLRLGELDAYLKGGPPSQFIEDDALGRRTAAQQTQR